MRIKIFTIPISDDGTAQAEMNRFLQSEKILKIEQQFYSDTGGALWCFCVSYLAGLTGNQTNFQSNKKVDYKSVLSEEVFKKFSHLRNIRKELSVADAVPAYAIFTDLELSQMAKAEVLNAQTILGIEGIAEKRLEKYGRIILERFDKVNIGDHEKS